MKANTSTPRRRRPVRLIRASSVSRALAVAGDRWSLLILAAAFQGVHGFEELRQRLGIASNVLAARLARFVRIGCLRRERVAGDARRAEYRLTRMGMDFYPTALMFWRFDSRWSPQQRRRVTLRHAACGRAMTPELVCGHCGEAVHAREVRYEDGSGAGSERLPPPRTSRRSSVALDEQARQQLMVGEAIEYFGDRWTQQILAAFFLGARRYGDICQRSQAATNIVADRLRRLVEHGMIQQRGVRGGYVLTPKGMDIYPIVVTLMGWGDCWLDRGKGAPLRLFHRRCGAPLSPRVVCDQCRGDLHPDEVRLVPSS